jgi:predicted ATPase
MAVEITKIAIKNFKNLKDVIIKPKKFNVLIGPNGSGKTNFLEFFKLLRKIYIERNPYPFLEWDGYENVVWNHQRSLPIEFEIETVERTTLTEFLKKYSWVDEIKLEKDLDISIFCKISASVWADRSENLKLLRESVEVEIPNFGYKFSIEKDGESWKVRLNINEYYLDKIEDLRCLHFEISELIKDGLRFEDFGVTEDGIRDIIFEIVKNLPANAIKKFTQELEESIRNKGVPTKFIITDIFDKKGQRRISLSGIIWDSLPKIIYQPMLAFFETIVLFSLNIQEIKYKRKIIPRDEPLNERGENILDILALIQLRENKLPKRIEYALENYFSGRGYFKNMNFYLYDLNSRTEFSKEHLPDGLIKLLVILTALEQNPSILLIDEIENSLHPELLEFVINVLREECEGCVFVTTHSPIVLNLVEPEEIFIFKPTDDGVEVRNLTEYKSKGELMKELKELGITLGEKVFHAFT